MEDIKDMDLPSSVHQLNLEEAEADEKGAYDLSRILLNSILVYFTEMGNTEKKKNGSIEQS